MGYGYESGIEKTIKIATRYDDRFAYNTIHQSINDLTLCLLLSGSCETFYLGDRSGRRR